MKYPASFTDQRDYNPPCQNCGHEYEDHGPADDRDDDDDCRFCACEMYDDERQEPDPDRGREERFG